MGQLCYRRKPSRRVADWQALLAHLSGVDPLARDLSASGFLQEVQDLNGAIASPLNQLKQLSGISGEQLRENSAIGQTMIW